MRLAVMSRAERYLWNGLLIAGAWVAYFEVESRYGTAAADEVRWVFMLLLATAVIIAASGEFARSMGWQVRRPITAFRLWSNRSWKWSLGVLHEPRSIDGLRLWVGRGLSPKHDEQLPRVAEAMAIVERARPSRIGRLRRLGVQIAVAHIPGYALYMPGVNVLAIDPAALDESPAVLASLLVHELNHALTTSRGFLHPWLDERTERLACRDQYNFGFHLHASGYRFEGLRARELALHSLHPDRRWRTRWKGVAESIRRRSERT